MRWNGSELNAFRSYAEDLANDFEEMRAERDNLLEEVSELNEKLVEAAKEYAELEAEFSRTLEPTDG